MVPVNLWAILIGMKRKKYIWKKNQNGQLKKTEIFNFPNSQYFFMMWLNLYGCEAVRHKLKNGQKTPKIHFFPVLGLMSDSLTAI